MSTGTPRELPWRPRSLQARQLMAASLGLLAFLALAGFALDRAFLDVASEGQRDRLRNYAYAYAGEVMACNMMSEDAGEGIDAFMQKRKPVYTGR